MYDVVIIGAGPAGATLARLIVPRFNVLLLDKRTFDDPRYIHRQKCCGGLLDPDAQQMVAAFGLGLPKDLLANPQMFAVRTLDFDNDLERYYQRHYVNVDREAFDRWLVSLVPDDVTVQTGCLYRGHELMSDGIRLRYDRGGSVIEARTRLVVGADGAFSAVRRRAFRESHFPPAYVAIQEWFHNTTHINYYGAIFDREVTDFYAWLIPKDAHLIIGAALAPHQAPHAKFALLKEKLRRFGFQFGPRARRHGTYLLRPRLSKHIHTGSGRVALVGEAAGFISPSSAEGISYAFKSARALAAALNENADDWEALYRKKTLGLRRNIRLKVLKAGLLYNKTFRRLIMQTGIQSVSVERAGSMLP